MKLSDADRNRMRKLTGKIEDLLHEMREVMNRNFDADKGYQDKKLIGEIVEFRISRKDAPAEDSMFVEIDVGDGKGNCGVWRDPPGICEPKPCTL